MSILSDCIRQINGQRDIDSIFGDVSNAIDDVLTRKADAAAAVGAN